MNNELTDIRLVNMPELNAPNIEYQDWFSFGVFLPPGYHKLLIFDPKYQRAFCKDVIIKLNRRDQVYPEYPVPSSEIMKKYVPNMWKNWVEDTLADYISIFKIESKTGYINIDRYIKNEEDRKKCLKILHSNLDVLLVLHKELLIKSPIYPFINFESVNSFVESI